MKTIKLFFVIGILANSSMLFTACTDQEQKETQALYLDGDMQQATDDADEEVPMDKEDNYVDPPVIIDEP